MSSQWYERRDESLRLHAHHLRETRKHLQRSREMVRNTFLLGVSGVALTTLALLVEARFNENNSIEIATLLGGSLVTISAIIGYSIPKIINHAASAAENGEYAIGFGASALGHHLVGKAIDRAKRF